MNFRDDYLEKDADGKTWVYYDESGNLVMKHLGEKDNDRKAIVPNPDQVPRAFPCNYIGPHYIQNGVIHDFRVKSYEYCVDLTAIPPAFIKVNHLEDFLKIDHDLSTLTSAVLSHLKKHYQELASRSDSIAMEYYKKSLLPEYGMKVDPDSLALLKKYPALTQRFNEAKGYITSITQAMLDDPDQRATVVKNLINLLNEDYFEV